jgi:hypothetical protein
MSDLERALAELGEQLDAPRVDLSDRVLAAIAARRTARWRFAAMAAAAAVLLAAVVISLAPGVRSAVADFLGLGGVRIERGGPRPVPAPGLGLGRRVSLDRARALVDFQVAVPALLGAPDQTFYDAAVARGQVALAYGARPGLPAAPGTRLGALITQFRGRLDEPVLVKTIGSRARVVPVRVGRSRGLWISGPPHVITYRDAFGAPLSETVRLAGHVVVWQRAGVTYRLESALGRGAALRIARSVR